MFRKFVLVTVMVALLSACSLALPGSDADINHDAVQTAAVATYQAAQGKSSEPTANPNWEAIAKALMTSGPESADQPESGSTPTATNAPVESCLSALPKSVNRPFQWVNNLDVGDAALTSLLYVANNSGDSLVALIDPVFNYDVEAPKMTGAYYQTSEWSVEKLMCAARELASQNGVTNLIYIGLGDTPSGFTKDYNVAGFTTSIWVYTETPIDTAPTRWSTFTAALTDSEHTYGSNDAYWYGQFWNGKDSKVVYHWIAEPGWQISTPKLQGTYWSVQDYSDVFEAVLQRFLQMTFEVLQRDGHPNVVRVFCGNGTAPTGYTKPSQPSDWTCTPMP